MYINHTIHHTTNMKQSYQTAIYIPSKLMQRMQDCTNRTGRSRQNIARAAITDLLAGRFGNGAILSIDDMQAKYGIDVIRQGITMPLKTKRELDEARLYHNRTRIIVHAIHMWLESEDTQ